MLAGFMGNSVLCIEAAGVEARRVRFRGKGVKRYYTYIRNPQFYIPV